MSRPCTHCGDELPDDGLKHCPRCGQAVHAIPAPDTTPVVYTKPAPPTGFASTGQIIAVLLWVGVLFATIVAGLAFLESESAPQQAAAAAMAIIPYVGARAWDGLRRAAG